MKKHQVYAALLLLLLLAACAAPPTPVNVEVTRVVEATRLVEVTRIVTAPPEPTYTPYPTHTPYPTLTLAPSATPVPSLTPAPTIAPTLTPATGPTLPDILAAFRAAGLEAESARAMTRDDYGLAPLLGTGYRFLIPSLCPDCGGRLYQFDSLVGENIGPVLFLDVCRRGLSGATQRRPGRSHGAPVWGRVAPSHSIARL
jgi:hypothetical protein